MGLFTKGKLEIVLKRNSQYYKNVCFAYNIVYYLQINISFIIMEPQNVIFTLIAKFIKFGFVGLSGLFIDFGLTYLCKEKFQVPKYLSNSIGFITAASSNYYLNRIWTFESQNPEILSQYGKFIIISIIGLCLNNLIIYILNDRKGYNFYAAKLIAIGCTLLWNFSANYIFTF